MAGTFAEELVDDIVSEGLATAKATDIFTDQLPNSPDEAVAIKEILGQPELGAPVIMRHIQCLNRAADWDTARKTAADIYNRYHGATALTFENSYVLYSGAAALPQPIGEDRNRRHLLSTNYWFRVRGIAPTPTLTISGFHFISISRTSVQIDFDTPCPTKCELFVRTDTGPGEWVETSNEDSFHLYHRHNISGLTQGTWYHLYIHAYNESGIHGYWPYNDPDAHGYNKFKTATPTEEGEDAGVFEE